MRPLILVGGGGHCLSVIEAAVSVGFEIKGILDLPKELGKRVLGFPIIGTDEDASKYVVDCDFIVTLGFIKNPSIRIKIHEHIKAVGCHFATVIASTAVVSRFASIGEGTVVLHNAIVNAGANVGFGCIINTAANIEHSVQIGDYCHISTGAMINGDCKVGERSFIGSQSVIFNGKSVCSDCIIGAGSVVRKDITIPGTYNGNPAIFIKKS